MKKIFITGLKNGFGKSLKNIFYQNSFEIYGISKSIVKETDKIKKIDLKNTKNINSKLNLLFKNNKKFEYLILNAGSLGPITKTVELKIKEIKKNLDINVFSNKLILDYVIKNNIKFKSIIAISSGASLKIKFGWYNYCLSKVALRFLIESYALEYKKLHLINYNPGLIETSMQRKLRKINSKKIPSVKLFKENYIKGNIQKPEDAAIKLYNNLSLITSKQSGSYIDSRNLNIK